VKHPPLLTWAAHADEQNRCAGRTNGGGMRLLFVRSQSAKATRQGAAYFERRELTDQSDAQSLQGLLAASVEDHSAPASCGGLADVQHHGGSVHTVFQRGLAGPAHASANGLVIRSRTVEAAQHGRESSVHRGLHDGVHVTRRRQERRLAEVCLQHPLGGLSVVGDAHSNAEDIGERCSQYFMRPHCHRPGRHSGRKHGNGGGMAFGIMDSICRSH